MKLTPDQLAAHTLLRSLLRSTTTRVSGRHLTAAVSQHEQPLTLLALHEILAYLGVDTLATKLAPEEVPELPCPAVAYLNIGDSGCFVVVYETDQQSVSWQHPEYGRLSTSLATFIRVWTGIVLLTELVYQADTPDEHKKS